MTPQHSKSSVTGLGICGGCVHRPGAGSETNRPLVSRFETASGVTRNTMDRAVRALESTKTTSEDPHSQKAALRSASVNLPLIVAIVAHLNYISLSASIRSLPTLPTLPIQGINSREFPGYLAIRNTHYLRLVGAKVRPSLIERVQSRSFENREAHREGVSLWRTTGVYSTV